jgi:hypothetical protein
VPNDILQMIVWYATKDPSPKLDEWNPSEEGTSRNSFDGAASRGLNSVRGYTAWAIARLLFEHKEYYDFFKPYVEQMVDDESLPVSTQVAYVLLPLLNIDRDYAVNLLLQLCEGQHQAILSSHFITDFLSYAHWTHYREVMPIVRKMLVSNDPEVVNIGSQFVCMVMLTHEDSEATELAHSCRYGSDAMREGVVKMAVARLLYSDAKEWCQSVLIQMFNDESKEIRDEASLCFNNMSGENLNKHSDLIQEFITSQAFHEDAHWFFDALKDSLVPLPDIICSAFERSADLMRDVSVQEVHREGRFIYRESQILVRLYERTPDSSVKTRCLDIIDELAKTEAASSLDQTLQARDL